MQNKKVIWKKLEIDWPIDNLPPRKIVQYTDCDAVNCMNTKTIKAFGGQFCRDHISEMKSIRSRIKNAKSLQDYSLEYYARLMELLFRKYTDIPHVHALRNVRSKLQTKNGSIRVENL